MHYIIIYLIFIITYISASTVLCDMIDDVTTKTTKKHCCWLRYELLCNNITRVMMKSKLSNDVCQD